jgi:thiol:disulfide interchange protein DsbD
MRHLLTYLFATCLLQAGGQLFAQDTFGLNSGNRLPLVNSRVLPAEEAFAFTALIEAPHTLVLLWDIKEGYYLYKNSIAVTDTEERDIAIGELPDAEMMEDEFFGEVGVYFERLLHRFPLAALPGQDHTYLFIIRYQGCAEDLYCYPMQQQTIELSLPE